MSFCLYQSFVGKILLTSSLLYNCVTTDFNFKATTSCIRNKKICQMLLLIWRCNLNLFQQLALSDISSKNRFDWSDISFENWVLSSTENFEWRFIWKSVWSIIHKRKSIYSDIPAENKVSSDINRHFIWKLILRVTNFEWRLTEM